jgi:hypothetical protein
VFVALYLFAAAFALWLHRSRGAGALSARDKRFLRVASVSVVILTAWYFLFAGYPLMRYLWNGYALLGWLVAFCVARLLADPAKHWKPPLAFAIALLLIAVSPVGSLRGLVHGLGDPTWSWRAQEVGARELNARFPNARLFYSKWEYVTIMAFFMNKLPYALEDFKPDPGDVFACDYKGAGCMLLTHTCATPTTLPPSTIAYCAFQ